MSPKPIVTSTSQYDHRHTCDCEECADARFKARNPHLYGADDPLGPSRGIINGVICSMVIVALFVAVVLLWPSLARGAERATPRLSTSGAQRGVDVGRLSAPHPIKARQSLLKARQACPNTASIVECRSALVRAYRGVEWQRHARLHQGSYGVQHALRLASALYGVPMSELVRVGTCESHLTPSSKNRTSTASGLFQFLDSTWNRAGIPGFSVFDPYANAIAAARLVTTDGSWREWSCQP